MGAYWSTATIPSLSNEINSVVEYICAKSYTNHALSVDPNVKLVVKRSKLPSAFIEGRHMGLFTKDAIPKGTIILSVFHDDKNECKMNDGAVDLEPILVADTNEKTYQAWMNMKNSYYNIEKIKNVVNVRMIVDNTNNCFYETIQDIPAGGELVRLYGFTTWTLELLNILTNKTVVGFAHAIDDFSKNIKDDPYTERIQILHKVLESYDKDIFTRNRLEHDKSLQDEPLIFVGDDIEKLYVMQLLNPNKDSQ